MRHPFMFPALAFAVALSGAACSSDTAVDERTAAAADEAAREADRAAEVQRQHNEDITQMEERLTSLQRDYDEKAATARGTAGTAADRMRTTLAEDMSNVREAVSDLRTTTAENWWDRHEAALKQSIDEVEGDVKQAVGARALPAPAQTDPAMTTREGVSTEPFLSRRDRFVAEMNARIDGMHEALDKVNARGARKTAIDDLKARVDKLDEDVDKLKSADADDWWDISKARVNEYIERVEDSIARLDDNAK